ncbi:MAG TPA: hypothetical protein VG815_17500, partial [Chloroflexota bacterium]|nr:hypothetical protein [Chloroflexota bacterium]
LLNKEAQLGFKVKHADDDEAKELDRTHADMVKKVMGELKNTFKPEFMNRIDASIVFRALTQEQVYQIADILLARVRSQLVEQQIELTIDDSARGFLVEEGFDVANGARPLRRTIQNRIEDPLAEGMLSGRFYPGMRIEAHRSEDGIELVATEVVETREPVAAGAGPGDESTSAPEPPLPPVTAEAEG